MSQRTVELMMGRLLTDEELRLRFSQDPFSTIVQLVEQGFDFSKSEIEAFVEMDRYLWSQAAVKIHPRFRRNGLGVKKESE